MTAYWKPTFSLLREEYHFNYKSHIFLYYGKVTSSNKKIMQLLKSNPKQNLEKETLMYFKRYVHGLDGSNLRKVTLFLTRSDVVVVEKIDIVYYKRDREFCRRPLSHTCGSCFELPTIFVGLYNDIATRSLHHNNIQTFLQVIVCFYQVTSAIRVNLHSVVDWMSKTPCAKHSQAGSTWPLWLNDWVFGFGCCGCGF